MENSVESFDLSVPVANDDDFFRACLAAEYSKYVQKAGESNGISLEASEIQKVLFRKFNYENISKEKCVRELYRIRLSEYQHEYMPSGYKPTRQQKNDVRNALESELAETRKQKNLPELPRNFVSKLFLTDSRPSKSQKDIVSFKKIYAEICDRYGIKKEKSQTPELSRRDFVKKFGFGLGATVLGGALADRAFTSIRGDSTTKPNPQHKPHIPPTIVQSDDNSPNGRFKRAINMIYENPSLFSKLGLSYIAGDKFTEYINQSNLMEDGWQPSEEEQKKFDALRANIVDMITTMKLDSAVFRGFYQSPGDYDIIASDRSVAQVNFEINGEEFQFTDTDLINGSHLASTKAYKNSYSQKRNSTTSIINPAEHDDLDNAVYEAVAFALSDIDINLDSSEITETPNTKLVDEIIDNTKQNSPER